MKSRWPVQKRLADVIARHPILAGAKVTAAPPPEMQATSEHVFCVGSEGALSGVTFYGGRQIKDDAYTITVRVITRKGDGTIDSCMSRASEIAGAIYDVIADGAYDGLTLVDWGVEDDWEVHEVSPGEASLQPQQDPQEKFFYAVADIGVDFEVRHAGGNP